MFLSFWAVKGGSGTTVVAVSMALLLARSSPDGVLLVDLAGDVPAVLGCPEPTGPGVAEWLAAGEVVPADGLARLEVRATSTISVIPRGSGPIESIARADVLAAALGTERRPVIVDCGLVGAFGTDVAKVLASSATQSVLVTRPCYLALRRAVSAPVHPSAVVVVGEVGRSLVPADVGDVVQSPVLASVPYDAAIARAVDAGLLSGRLPRELERALRSAA